MGTDRQDLFDALRRGASDVVAVVGAGIAIACGAPSSNDLARELTAASGRTFPESFGLYDIADALELERGTVWVQDVVATCTARATLTPSLALRALTLIPARIIVTTNYDSAIEVAAGLHGLLPVTLLPADLARMQRGPRANEFFVLHIHGSANTPSSVVLTQGSYDAAQADEQLKLTLRSLAVGHILVFFGHTLASRELHVRRDIDHVVRLFGEANHVLLHPEGEIAEPDQFHASTGVRPVGFPNEDGQFAFVLQAAQLIIPRPVLPSTSFVPPSTLAADVAYQPLPVAPAYEVADETAREVWHYGRYFGKPPLEAQELANSRVLLIGGPGCGKSQTMLRLMAVSVDPAVYLRLGGCMPPDPAESVDAVFSNWMEAGVAANDTTPRVSSTTLIDGKYTFLLDGLDEVRADRRRGVLDAIVHLAEQHPQHRWIVATRRVPEIRESGPVGFEEYELMPGREWLHAYAGQRGVAPNKLDQIASHAAGLESLIDIPLFGAAAVTRILTGRPLPDSPLELLLDFASEGMAGEETRLRQHRAGIDDWLDRLALAMVASNKDSFGRREAASPTLRGTVDSDVTIDWLTTRALVAEQSGEVRFPTRTIRDARAARALGGRADGEAHLVHLAVADVVGELYLRPQWQYVVDLLLADDHDRWAPALEEVDPLAVARAVSPKARESERSRAVDTIWEWYASHKLHLTYRAEGQLVNDLDAIVALAGMALPPRPLASLQRALQSGDWVSKGNAALILAHTGHRAEVTPHLINLLDHDEPTVRRRAAEAIQTLQLAEFAEALTDRAARETDELARRALASAAVTVADADALPGLLRNMGPRLRNEVQLSIDRRWTRHQQLIHQQKLPIPDKEVLSHLARPDDEAWSAPDVEMLAKLWALTDSPHVPSGIQTVLVTWPAAALAGWFRSLTSSEGLFEVWFLLDAVGDETSLRTLADGNAMAEAVVVEYLEHRRRRQDRQEDPGRARAASPSQRTVLSLTQMIAKGDVRAILSRRPSDDEVSALTPMNRSELRRMIGEWWTAGTPFANIVRTNNSHWAPKTESAFPLIDWAATLSLPLHLDEWIEGVNLGLPGSEFSSWFTSVFKEEWMPAIIEQSGTLTADGLELVIESFPVRLSQRAATALTERCIQLGREPLDGSSELVRRCAERLAADEHFELVRQLADAFPSAETDAVLASLGDEAAEARLLATFRQVGYPSFEPGRNAPAWIKDLRHSSSTGGIVDALVAMLRRGDEAHELSVLFRALNRCAREGAIAIYDQLRNDETIPHASFLWYRRQECVDYLMQTEQPSMRDGPPYLY